MNAPERMAPRNRAGRPRGGQSSRDRILHVASELFSQRGYGAVGVDELAKRSGIAKTAIYYHFGNKEGLLTAVLERAAIAWIEAISQAARQAGDPLERLDRALLGMRTLLEERAWILKLLQILALEVSEQKPEIRQRLRALTERARKAIVDGLRDALQVEVQGAETVAAILLALLDGVSLGLQIAPEEIPLDQAFAEIRRLVILMVVSRLNPELVSGLERGLQADVGPLRDLFLRVGELKSV